MIDRISLGPCDTKQIDELPQHIYNKTIESGLYGTFVKWSKNTRRRRRKAHDQLQYKLDDDL